MIEKIKTQEPEDSQYDSFTDKEGNIYKIKMIPDDKEGLLIGVQNGTSKEKKLLPREWEVFKTRKGLEAVTTVEPEEEIQSTPKEGTKKPKKEKFNVVNYDNSDGILSNEVPRDLVKKGVDKQTRWGDNEKQKVSNLKKNATDRILDNLDTTPPEDLNLREVSDWEPSVPEEALETNEVPVVKTPKRGRPKKVVETPPVIKQSLEEAGKIMAELEKPNKKEVPLNLKQGQIIWNDRGDEVIVVDVVTNPINEEEGLMEGYAVLGFPPKQGRNSGYVREKVPFSKLENRKGKIFLTEQIPFVEIDKEAEAEEPPPLPAEYLAKVEAEKRLAEGRRLAQLREEISHGDLGADLAKDWTPIDVEMPKRQAPLSKFAKKAVKKSWWQRLLGL